MANTQTTSSQRSTIMNGQIYARNIGTQTSTINLPPVPSATRRDYTTFSAPAIPRTVQASSNGLMPNGIPEATYKGYADHINDDSVVKAIHKPLSRCMANATFMPNALSDLYQNYSLPPTYSTPPYGYVGDNSVDGTSSRHDVPLPNQSVFSNHTRQQTKSLDGH